jgi:hypothetical protein
MFRLRAFALLVALHAYGTLRAQSAHVPHPRTWASHEVSGAHATMALRALHARRVR